MKSARRAAILLDRVLTSVLQGTAALLLLGILVTVGYQVFARYVLKRGVAWGEELPLLLNVWLTMLGAALVLRYRGHVAIDFFVKSLPHRISKWVVKSGQVIILSFSFLLLWQGLLLGSKSMPYRMATLCWPMAVFYLSIPVGAAAMVFYSVGDIVGWLKERKLPEKDHEH